MNLTADSRDFLIALARRSIHCGLPSRRPATPDLGGCPAEVLDQRASFVTLTTASGELRGCRGSLLAQRALAVDVWQNAAASAFQDPRFAPVTASEFAALRVEISVLGPLEAVPAGSEAELCRALVPHVDGVVLAWRGQRATFLPQVWGSLPEPRDFLAELRLKAGLPADFWATDLVVQRYRVEKFGVARPSAAQAS